ncbi:MAG: Formate dehydrogenase [Gemmataceae bacterium]|nr:Formate dehydrogenase [Gemmataceae bacterium]
MKIVAVLYPSDPAASPDLLAGSAEALRLRPFIRASGHEFVVLTDNEGDLDRHLPTADVLITTPFWPAYVTRERFERAPLLKLVLTAGVGSDHIDLAAAAGHGVTVAEITGSNVVSVAEHAVMMILALVRNFIPAYRQVLDGRWDIAELAARAHDLEGKTVGVFGTGRIGQRVLARLKPFGVTLIYNDIRPLDQARAGALGAEFVTLNELLGRSDVISINTPLTPQTDQLFNSDRLARMKPGSYLVNTARGRIVDTAAVVEAVASGQLAGYAGDVWYPQPAPADHPWRHMPRHAMTPHYAGTTLEAQWRYADGIHECLQRFFDGQPLPEAFLVVAGGRVVGPSYRSAFEPARAG